MDVNDAIKSAKEYISKVYSDEGVFNVGLEEVELDDNSGIWEVTVGFSRRWDRPIRSAIEIAMVKGDDTQALHRTYKIVEIDDSNGNVMAVRNRPGLT